MLQGIKFDKKSHLFDLDQNIAISYHLKTYFKNEVLNYPISETFEKLKWLNSDKLNMWISHYSYF